MITTAVRSPTSITAAAISLYDAVSYTSGAWDSIAGMFSTSQTEGDEEGLMPLDDYGGLAGVGDKLQDGCLRIFAPDEPKEEDHFDLPDWIKTGANQLGKGLADVALWVEKLTRSLEAQSQVEQIPGLESEVADRDIQPVFNPQVDGQHTYFVAIEDNKSVSEDKDSEESADLKQAREELKATVNRWLSEGANEEEKEEFRRGVMEGFTEGIKQWVDLAKTAKAGITVLRDRLGPVSPFFNAVGYAERVCDTLFGTNLWEQEVAGAEARLEGLLEAFPRFPTASEAAEAAGMMGEITLAIGESVNGSSFLSSLFGNGLLTISPGPKGGIDEELNRIIDKADPILVKLGGVLKEVGPHLAGKIVGIVLYEVAEWAVLSTVIGTPTAGSGAAATTAFSTVKLVRRLETLEDLAGNVKLLDKIRDALRSLRRDPRGAAFFDDLARQGTRNPNSTKVVIGKFLEDGQSYVKVGAHYRASYLKLENWRALSKTLSEAELWKINETFLRQQIKQGKQFILSHDPSKATGFFKNEVDFLSNFYRFEKDGWVWRAIPK